MNRNRPRPSRLAALATGLLALMPAYSYAQYSPAPPRPYPGYINDYLRSKDPYNNQWDIGVNIRARLENKDNAGFTSAGSNRDFSGGRPTGGAIGTIGKASGDRFDNNNTYVLTRIMPRIGYTDKWFSVFTEFRSSDAIDDERENNGTTFKPLTGNAVETANAPGIKAGKGLTEQDTDLNLYQAYFTIGNHKEFPVSAKIGRQELVPGGVFPTPAGQVGPDQRQVGHFRWNNNGRSFDAAKVRYQNAYFGLDLWTGGVVYTDDDNFNESHYDTDKFNGAYFNFPTISRREVVEAYIYQRDVDRASTTEDWAGVPAPFRQPVLQELYTVGLRVKSKPLAYDAWDYSVELMHQFGTIRNRDTQGNAILPINAVGRVAGTAPTAAHLRSVELTQNASAAIIGAGYSWTEAAWQPRLGFIYSYASGDDNASDGESGTFQNQFATTHLHYGYMDLNSLQNLHDFRTVFTFKPKDTVTVALEHHFQFLATTNDYWYNVAGVARGGGATTAGTLPTNGKPLNNGNGFNRNGKYDNALGQELDLVVGWYPKPWLHIEAGVSHYFAGDYIEQTWAKAPGKSLDASYTYVQTTFNF
ncbi:MAG: hypothetical protein RIQ79_1236 [Verrucomicrobiota bacterium]